MPRTTDSGNSITSICAPGPMSRPEWIRLHEMNAAIAWPQFSLGIKLIQLILHPSSNRQSILSCLRVSWSLRRRFSFTAIDTQPRNGSGTFSVVRQHLNLFDVLGLVGATNQQGLRKGGPVPTADGAALIWRHLPSQEGRKLVRNGRSKSKVNDYMSN